MAVWKENNPILRGLVNYAYYPPYNQQQKPLKIGPASKGKAYLPSIHFSGAKMSCQFQAG